MIYESRNPTTGELRERVEVLSEYGLGATVFSADLERAARLAGEIEAGCVAINDFVRSTPELPFGG